MWTTASRVESRPDMKPIIQGSRLHCPYEGCSFSATLISNWKNHIVLCRFDPVGYAERRRHLIDAGAFKLFAFTSNRGDSLKQLGRSLVIARPRNG